jgi:diacylglycerol kinase (ATP)
MTIPPRGYDAAAPVPEPATPAQGTAPVDLRSKAELTAAIHAQRRTVLVVNNRSRRGRRHYPQIRARLDATGFNLLAMFPVDQPGQLAARLDTAIALRPDLLVVGGGDGSISQAVRHVAHRDIALAVLPLGTTNNFARTLGIPLRLADALDVLTGGKVADVDLGQVNGIIFANLVSVGVSAKVAGHVPARLKRLAGRAAYPITALIGLPWHRSFHTRLIAGNTVRQFDTHQLNIANGAFHAGRPITAHASADDRLLIAYPLGGAGRVGLLAATVRHALTGHRRTGTEPLFVTGTDLWLHTDPPQALDIDGEISGRTPAHLTLAPNALRVMVAPDFPDT